MMKHIKQFFGIGSSQSVNLFDENCSLNLKLAQKNIKIQELEERLGNPRGVIDNVFENGIEWYDWNDQPEAQRKQFFQEAQTILNTEIFRNIKNYLIATGAQEAMLSQHKGNEAIRDFQMTINGMELLQRELETIQNPDQPQPTVEEPFKGV